MLKRSNKVTDFLGMASTTYDDTDLPPSVASELKNVRPIHGGLVSRAGSIKDNADSFNEDIKELFILPTIDGRRYFFVVTQSGDTYESPRDVYLWCKIPQDADDDRLFPHVQLDNNSDLSSPYVDAECKTDRNYWEYREVTEGEVWQAIPDAGIPTAVMTAIRVSGTEYRVRYAVPANTAGLARGLNYMRFRFWDGYEYGSYSTITSVLI